MLMAGSLGIFLCSCKSTRGALIDSREFNENGIQIRILHYKERDPVIDFLPGAYYVYQSRQGSQDWKDFLEVRRDDPDPIPVDKVHIFSSGHATVFLDSMFATTADRGKTWQVWDAQKTLPGWECCRYRTIKAVEINDRGNGIMKLEPIPANPSAIVELHTADFGKSWTPR